MTPEYWRWSAHRQWHPVVGAHPLTRLTFQTAITAPGPPIQTKTPTHKNNGHHCSHTRATLFGPSSFLCPLLPSVPGPILLLILTHSLEEFSVIACSHISVMAMTTGQVLVYLLSGSTRFQLMWLSTFFVFSKWLYGDLPTTPSHLHDWFCLFWFCKSHRR